MNKQVLRVSKLKNPEAWIKSETSPIKIKVVGPTHQIQRFISHPLKIAENEKNVEVRESLIEEYTSRLIKASIKEVEGVEYENENGEWIKFELEFEDDLKSFLTQDSFVKILDILDYVPNFVEELGKFFDSTKARVSVYNVEDDKKKD